MSPFLRALRYTNFYIVICSINDRLRHASPDKKAHIYFEQNKDRIKKIKSRLADERSRLVFEHVIKYHWTKERKNLIDIPEKNQYFGKDIIKFGNKEIFVDCGAYNGDTIIAFLKNLKKGEGKFKEIIALEPDPDNYRELDKWALNLVGGGSAHIRCFNLGTWNEKGHLSFKAGMGGDSQLRESRKNNTNTEYELVTINVDTLDNILGDKPVTFIKMDIEGSELPSLKGAEKVISKNLPRLAICIYHSNADMLDIPEYIMEKYPSYSFYVRHYSQGIPETVLYAIPEQFRNLDQS